MASATDDDEFDDDLPPAILEMITLFSTILFDLPYCTVAVDQRFVNLMIRSYAERFDVVVSSKQSRGMEQKQDMLLMID